MAAPRFADITAWTRARRWLVLAAALALLAAGSASASAAYRAPAATTHTEEHVRWTERAAYAYDVPVTRNSTHWPIGTVLPMGMPAYFHTISDHMPFTFTWNATGAAGNASSVTSISVRALAHDGREYWSVWHELAIGETRDASQGLVVNGDLDLDGIIDEVAQLDHELPIGDGEINWSLETNVSYTVESAGDAPGQGEQARETFAFPLVVQEPRILLPLPADITWQKPHAQSVTWTTSAPAGWDGVLGDLRTLALLLVGGGAAALLAFALYGDPLARLSEADAAYVREHQRHRSWVTSAAGELDVGGFPHAVVDVGTLSALVQAAADARCRVLHDPALRVYYAVLPNATYRYARHAKAA